MHKKTYVNKKRRVGPTGCWGASLSILKTCATFPLARRCILKLGIAQRVARLIILEHRGRITLRAYDRSMQATKKESRVI